MGRPIDYIIQRRGLKGTSMVICGRGFLERGRGFIYRLDSFPFACILGGGV